MRELIRFRTSAREELVDITPRLRDAVRRSGVRDGLVAVYAQGATGAVMIQENWDDSVQTDVVDLLRKLIPRGVWRHDAQDGNGDSHLKAGLVGPSETIPVIAGELGLSTWQNVFFCGISSAASVVAGFLVSGIVGWDSLVRRPRVSCSPGPILLRASAHRRVCTGLGRGAATHHLDHAQQRHDGGATDSLVFAGEFRGAGEFTSTCLPRTT